MCNKDSLRININVSALKQNEVAGDKENLKYKGKRRITVTLRCVVTVSNIVRKNKQAENRILVINFKSLNNN